MGENLIAVTNHWIVIGTIIDVRILHCTKIGVRTKHLAMLNYLIPSSLRNGSNILVDLNVH